MKRTTEIKNLGGKLSSFLTTCPACSATNKGRRLFRVYVCGKMASGIEKKGCKAIPLALDEGPRALQRFLAPSNWRYGELGISIVGAEYQ